MNSYHASARPIQQAIFERKSTRAFLDHPVEAATIERILLAARYAPSGTNTQPWEVAIVSGKTRQQLTQQLTAAFEQGDQRQMDYQYYPAEWRPPYDTRRRETGHALYSALNITRDDKAARAEQWAKNYHGFGAPMLLFFFLPSDAQRGTFLDTGMFIQSVMLAALDEGLATCPQGALGEFPAIVKETLGYPDEHILLCGMAIGYPDTSAAVNSFRTSRIPLADFVKTFD